MSDPIIKIAKMATGHLLAGNPATPNSSRTLLNMFNNQLYRR